MDAEHEWKVIFGHFRENLALDENFFDLVGDLASIALARCYPSVHRGSPRSLAAAQYLISQIFSYVPAPVDEYLDLHCADAALAEYRRLWAREAG